MLSKNLPGGSVFLADVAAEGPAKTTLTFESYVLDTEQSCFFLYCLVSRFSALSLVYGCHSLLAMKYS